MNTMNKTKKRGFVMTGGGAKGLYEAGVIHAFHITGMEFDVITGSSIGAMNSIFFAEYLYFKKQLPEEIRSDPLQAVESMDDRVKAYHHAWLMMPDKHIIDDSAEGPIGMLKDDLLKFKLSLPQLTSLAWWWTDPDKRGVPHPSVWPALVGIVRQLPGRLGSPGAALRIAKSHRQELGREAMRTYLGRFKLDRSLIPDGGDSVLSDIFTQPVTPLRPAHLDGEVSAPDDPSAPKYPIIAAERTLRDFAQAGIDVRLTRANYRTGRLEVSAYVPVKDFVRFLDKQAWRIDVQGPEKIPLGSFRLQVPGNPVAINAALCSGRFPGVFRPYKLENIYPATDPENRLLHKLASGWLADPDVEAQIKPAYQELYPGQGNGSGRWAHWQGSQEMREFFPMTGDTYIDGGAIDNTPSNSAVDFTREWAERNGCSKRDISLELYVIFLGIEPKVTPDKAQDPTLFEVVGRTLAIQGAAKETHAAKTVDTINTYGQRAERLGRALELVLQSYQETLAALPEAQRQQAEAGLRAQAQAVGQRGYLGGDPEGILERMSSWTKAVIDNDLPIQVDEVKIYPEKMPLSTLQFTERFGYRKENAIEMLTMGCYSTLWTMRSRLEGQKPEDLDALDRQALALARKWMGVESWPADPAAQAEVQKTWRCGREACAFHARYCAHGARAG